LTHRGMRFLDHVADRLLRVEMTFGVQRFGFQRFGVQSDDR
jgi:hypothetical protein